MGHRGPRGETLAAAPDGPPMRAQFFKPFKDCTASLAELGYTEMDLPVDLVVVQMAQQTCDTCGYPIEDGMLYCINCGSVVPQQPAGSADSSWQGFDMVADGNAAPPSHPQMPESAHTDVARGPEAAKRFKKAPAPGWCPNCGARFDTTWVYCISCGEVLYPPEGPEGLEASADSSWDENADALVTMVYDESAQPSYSLESLSTGDVVALELPASVGRGSAADVRVSGDLGVSRVHVRLDVVDGQVMVADQHSANGTWINGTRLNPGEQRPLEDGDTLCLAREEFTFHVE